MRITSIHPPRLWFGLLGAPAAWIVQGLAGWFVGARICTQMSIGAVRIVGGAVGLAAVAVAGAGIVVGRDNWRRTTTRERPTADRIEFLTVGGLFVSVSFAVGILWALLNSVLLNVCGGMR
jgi:hypothetical protein